MDGHYIWHCFLSKCMKPLDKTTHQTIRLTHPVDTSFCDIRLHNEPTMSNYRDHKKETAWNLMNYVDLLRMKTK